MSRRRNELAPTLFPFLAVLVCTLGTLILFLALVAQNATEAAQHDVANSDPADEEVAPRAATELTADQAERLIAEGKFRVEQLVSYRVEQTAELEEQRDRLTHLDEHVDRLREKLRRLREEVEAATSTAEGPSASRDEIVLLKEQIEAETEELRRLEAERESREPRIVIVPHDGPNGTDRRPVYLECTDDALTIWPEGTRLSFEQLLASTPAANPLDDALRIIRHHAMHHYGDESPPYPLLIVRPDGIDTYAAARRAMTDWDDQFGYELVPAATELAFPEADAALRDRIERAVAEAVRGQQALQAFIAGHHGTGQRGFGGGSAFPGGHGGTAGGVAGTDGRDRRGRDRVDSRTGAIRDGSDRDRGTGKGSGGGEAAYREPPRRPLPSLSAAKLDQLARSKGYRSAGSFDAASVSDPLGRARRSYPPLPSIPESRNELNSAPFSGRGIPVSGRGISGAASATGDGEPVGNGSSASDRDSAGKGDSVGKHGSARESDTGTERAGEKTGDEDAARREAPTADRPLTAANGSTEGEVRGGERDAGESQTGIGTANDEAAEGSGDGGSTAGGPSNPAPTAATPSGGTSSASGSGSPPPEMAEADRERIPPSANSAPGSPRSQPRSDLVRRQGSRWGIPDHMSGIRGTAVVRGIRVVCYPDRYVLLPPSSGGATETFGLTDGDPRRATLELATAVRDRVARWGAPLPGGRWQPRLDVEVASGAESRAQWLREFMTGSGIDVRPVPHTGSPPR